MHSRPLVRRTLLLVIARMTGTRMLGQSPQRRLKGYSVRSIKRQRVCSRRLHPIIVGVKGSRAHYLCPEKKSPAVWFIVFLPISLSIAQHSREFGIRMALGATGADVLRLEFGRSSVIIISGLAVGLLLSLAMQGALSSFLFEVSALNPNIYAVAGAVLLFSTMTAVLIPALRAARTDPVIVFREM